MQVVRGSPPHPDNIKSRPLGVVPWSAGFEGSYPGGGQVAPVRRRFLSTPRPTAAAIRSPSRAAPRGRGRAGDGVGVRGRRGKPSGGCCGSCRQPLNLMRYRSDVGGQRPDHGRLLVPDAAGGALPWRGARERRRLPAPGDQMTFGPFQRAHHAQATLTRKPDGTAYVTWCSLFNILNTPRDPWGRGPTASSMGSGAPCGGKASGSARASPNHATQEPNDVQSEAAGGFSPGCLLCYPLGIPERKEGP